MQFCISHQGNATPAAKDRSVHHYPRFTPPFAAAWGDAIHVLPCAQLAADLTAISPAIASNSWPIPISLGYSCSMPHAPTVHLQLLPFKSCASAADLHSLALQDIAVSSGSACTSASLEPSYVLRALGVEDEMAHTSLRFGLGRFTTDAEVDRAIALTVQHVEKLRAMSPLWEMVQEGIDLKSIQWSQH